MALDAEGVEQLFKTAKAGELLGGLHPNDVRALIRQGRLHAKKLVVRGQDRKPRLYVTASEIDRFIRDLPDANEPIASASPPPRATRRRGLRAELQQATAYY